MKILDRYILITFLRTFFSVFIIFMFIFVLQGLWLYISELAGKDLDASVTFRFILYYTPRLIPLVVPLTILLSSIMVFGNFAENYEFAAMKSTGISLQRAMRSLGMFIVALGIACFFFANNVIPWGEYEFYNLRKNIAKKKPTLAIAEGQFTEIGNINIKVDKKTGDEGQFLDGVIIHQKSTVKTGNYKVINSNKGELISSETSNVLKLKLTEGNYYEEMINRDSRKNIKKPHLKSYFENYSINVDLEVINSGNLDEKNHKDRYNMQNISQLNYTIDSLKKERKDNYIAFSKRLLDRSTYAALNLNIDTTKTKKDTIYKGEILNIFDTKKKVKVLNLAINSSNSTRQVIDSRKSSIEKNNIWLNKHIIVLHDKYVLAIACIILFFVGAPLGALIRKGGVGLPMVIAIVLFLTYHFFGIFAKNSAEKGTFSPVIGAWLSTVVMLPIGIYLTYNATNDRNVFQFNSILERLLKFFGIGKEKQTHQKTGLSEDSELFKTLEAYDSDKLIDMQKNYRQYDYTIIERNTILNILNKRGTTIQQLKLQGHYSNHSYDEALRLKNEFENYSKLTLILYGISLVFSIIYLVSKNNELYILTSASLLLYITIVFFYIIVFTKSFSTHYSFYKHLKKDTTLGINLLFIVLGIAFYFLVYYLGRKKIKEEMAQIE